MRKVNVYYGEVYAAEDALGVKRNSGKHDKPLHNRRRRGKNQAGYQEKIIIRALTTDKK